jgi:two-component system, chemotaxis family, sensor kinase CheA
MSTIPNSSEKNLILHAIEEGLFFLNPEYEIEENYSASLETIIDHKLNAGQSFISLLEHRVPENIISNTLEFLSLMFRSDLDEETITELNPLHISEFHYENRWGLWTSSKFLSFKFKRVSSEGAITKLICTVEDISKQILLSKKLEEIEKTTDKQMEWLVCILGIAPPLLKEFIEVTETEMTSIDAELKNSRGTEDYKVILHKILRTNHHLKSNASLLNLKFFKDKLIQFETEIDKIKDRSTIMGSDFVPAVIQLGEIRHMIEEVKILMQRFKHFNNSLRPTRRYEGGLMIRSLQNLVDSIAKELGRKIQFNYKNFDNSIIPYSHQQIVREFLILLIRFAVFYCIEKPEERKSANKNPMGIIEIETFSDRRIFGFKLRHDGRLIRIERLLQKTIDSSESEISAIGNALPGDHLGSEVIRLLFMPSIASSNLTEAEFSKEIFSDMDLVKKKLKMHGGKIKITFTSENFCEYTISLPKT